MSDTVVGAETVRQAVAKSFDAMQSRELRNPDEAGAFAANAAFESALRRDAERRSRRRPRRKRTDDAVRTHSGEDI